MRRPLTLAPALGLLLASVSVVPAVPSAAATPTCHGKPATIVGAPGHEVVGTDGQDVIVSNGAYRINAGPGADTICVTVRTASLRAGFGNDWVAAAVPVTVTLGPGDDTFRGSPGNDVVEQDDPSSAPAGLDRISTGDGDDRVFAGGGQGARPDVVVLGPGDDVFAIISWDGLPKRAASAFGGPGRDWLQPPALDNARISTNDGTLASGGRTVLEFSGFSTYTVRGDAGTLVFRGSSSNEFVIVHTPDADIRTNGGNDRVQLPAPGSSGPWPFLNLGPGRDRLDLSRRPVASATLDLAAGQLVKSGVTYPVIGVEDFKTGPWQALTVFGTAGANTLTLRSVCQASVNGRGGADAVVLDAQNDDPACSRVAHGGAGDDVLTGGPLAEELYGDEGHDTIHGGGGTDSCEAEVVDCPA